MTRPGIIIDGASLTCDGVVAVARDEAPVTIAAGAAAAARAAWETAREVAARRPVYGRATGVGANRNIGLAEDQLAGHGLRLLRSHAAGTGPLQPADLGRAMLVTRLNQIGAGGSGSTRRCWTSSPTRSTAASPRRCRCTGPSAPAT